MVNELITSCYLVKLIAITVCLWKLQEDDFKSDLHINQDGTFRDTLKVDTNYFYYTIGNPMYGVQVPVYLEKGKETAVNINLNSNPIAATFTGANVRYQ